MTNENETVAEGVLGELIETEKVSTKRKSTRKSNAELSKEGDPAPKAARAPRKRKETKEEKVSPTKDLEATGTAEKVAEPKTKKVKKDLTAIGKPEHQLARWRVRLAKRRRGKK